MSKTGQKIKGTQPTIHTHNHTTSDPPQNSVGAQQGSDAI